MQTCVRRIYRGRILETMKPLTVLCALLGTSTVQAGLRGFEDGSNFLKGSQGGGGSGFSGGFGGSFGSGHASGKQVYFAENVRENTHIKSYFNGGFGKSRGVGVGPIYVIQQLSGGGFGTGGGSFGRPHGGGGWKSGNVNTGFGGGNPAWKFGGNSVGGLGGNSIWKMGGGGTGGGFGDAGWKVGGGALWKQSGGGGGNTGWAFGGNGWKAFGGSERGKWNSVGGDGATSESYIVVTSSGKPNSGGGSWW